MSTTSATDLTNGQIKVLVSDIDANGAPYKTTPVTYELRWENDSPRSYHADRTHYDYFDVTITYECASATLTIGTNIGVWQYALNSGASNNNF
jgi:hypothetical protein